MGKTALVLAGGGSRGAYEVGVWRALGELDERFSIVTGTSVGALNGAAIAQGSFELAEQMWRELETSRVFDVELDETLPPKKKLIEAVKLFGMAAVGQGGAGTHALEALLKQYIDEDAVRSSPLDFGLVTVQLPAFKPVLIWKDEIPQGKLIDFLIASSSVFPAIQPRDIDGIKYIDGGYYDNMPVRMAIDRGADKVIAVNMRAVGVVRRSHFKGFDIREISSYWDLGAMLLFDPNSARLNMRLGYLDTMRSYGIYDGHAFAFVKGTAANTAKHLYQAIYNDLALLGFENMRHKFFDSVAWQSVSKRVFRRGVQSTARAFALSGMEISAEFFGLDPGTLYLPSLFNERLIEAVKLIPLPPALSAVEPWQNSSLPNVSEAVSAAFQLIADRRIRTRFLAKLIHSALYQKRLLDLRPLAALMPDDFIAALYLALTFPAEFLKR